MPHEDVNFTEQERKLDGAGLFRGSDAEENHQALQGYPGAKKLLSAEQIVRRDAAQGKKESQYLLGADYASKKNIIEAMKWLELSACQNHSAAQYEIGSILVDMAKRSSNPEEKKEAFQKAQFWIEMAANNGFVEAQYLLGCMYLFDQAIPYEKFSAEKLARVYLQLAEKENHKGATSAIKILDNLPNNLNISISSCRLTLHAAAPERDGNQQQVQTPLI